MAWDEARVRPCEPEQWWAWPVSHAPVLWARSWATAWGVVQAAARRLLRDRDAEGRVTDQACTGWWQASASSGACPSSELRAPALLCCSRPLLLLSWSHFLSQTSPHHCSLDFSVCSFSFEEKVVFQLSEYSCSGAAVDRILTSSCKSLLSFYPFLCVSVFPKTYMHLCIFFFSSCLSHFS